MELPAGDYIGMRRDEMQRREILWPPCLLRMSGWVWQVTARNSQRSLGQLNSNELLCLQAELFLRSCATLQCDLRQVRVALTFDDPVITLRVYDEGMGLSRELLRHMKAVFEQDNLLCQQDQERVLHPGCLTCTHTVLDRAIRRSGGQRRATRQ